MNSQGEHGVFVTALLVFGRYVVLGSLLDCLVTTGQLGHCRGAFMLPSFPVLW